MKYFSKKAYGINIYSIKPLHSLFSCGTVHGAATDFRVVLLTTNEHCQILHCQKASVFAVIVQMAVMLFVHHHVMVLKDLVTTSSAE